MARPEEFEITIGADGRIELNFNGMTETSYRRIIEVLRETVGPIESLKLEAEEGDPPRVNLRKAQDRTEEETKKIENRNRR